MQNILKVDNIEKYYGNKSALTKALNNISFVVNEGEFVAIMGASGSGKTTLLNCISTIDRVTAGKIYVDGENPKLILADEPTGSLDSKSSKMLLEQFEYLNQKLNATILMVTHDSFSASYSSRIIFIKDGKIFSELYRGDDTRKQFFQKIIEVQTLLGGDLNDII